MANKIETSLLVKGLTADTYALDVRGKTFVDGDIEINGNVNIVGTATTINTQTVQARDNKIELNYSGSTSTAIGGGIEILSGRTDGSSVGLTIDTDRDWNSNTGFNIMGRTSDATTNGLKVQNSGGTNTFVVRNDGATIVGNNMLFYQDKIGVGDFGLQSNLSIVNGNDVQYPIKVTSSNTTLTRFSLLNSGGVQTDLQIGNNNGSNSLYLGVLNTSIAYLDNRTSNRFEYRIVGDSKLVIDTSGNVGIGTSTPSTKLQIVAGSNQGVYSTSTNDIAINGTATGSNSYGIKGETDLGTAIRSNITNTSAIGLEVNYTPTNTSLFKVLGDGNVGIGTSSPTEKLEVSGNLKVNGNLTVTGNTILQSTNTSTLNITGTTTSRRINPESDNTYPLGDSNRRWSTIYTKGIRLYETRTGGLSDDDYINIVAPNDLTLNPNPAWTFVLPLLSGVTNSFLGVYSGDSNTSNTTWFSLSGGTGISVSQTSNASGGTMTLSSSPTSFYNEPSSTSVTWNVSGNSTNYKLTLTANTTLNLSNVRNGDYGTIILTQDSGGNRTVTLGTVNGSAATHKVVNGGAGLVSLTATANAIDILSFTYDGTNMYWNKGLNYT